MEDISPEERFHAAVEIIKNLPKSGTFHPSNDLKLKFYSYYKQATEGPCEIPKPGFWDIINRAKWDAWKGLGNMSKEEAMQHYVDEFFKICLQVVESTPHDTDADASAKPFMEMMEPLIKYAPKELEYHFRVNGNSEHDDLNEGDDTHYSLNESVEINNPKAKYFKGKDVGNKKTDTPDRVTEGTPDAPSAVNGHNMNGSNDSDSEEFSDTFDKVNEESDEDLVSTATVVEDKSCNPSISNAKGANIIHVRGGGDQRSSSRDANSPVSGASGNRSHRQSHQGRGGLDSTSLNAPSSSISGSSGGNRRSGGNVVLESPADVSEQLALAVIKLQHTMDQVVSRLDSLEILLQERRSNPCRQVSRMNNSFWSIFGISPRAALLILAWPFFAHWLLYVIEKRRRR